MPNVDNFTDQGGSVSEVDGTLNVDGTQNVAGTLNVTGTQNVDGTQNVEGTLNVGGTFDLETGHAFKINGVEAFIAQAIAAGYKLARGIDTPTSGSITVVSGLATIVAVVVQLQDAPTLTHMFSQGDIGDQAGSPAAGSFLLVSQKPTGSGDVTPIAATTPWGDVAWIAVGT